MLRDDPAFYLPNLYTFQNDNAFLGSFRGLRFRVKPEQRSEGEEKRGVLTALVWTGEYCLEESTPEAEAEFPLDEAGYDAVLDWLEGQYRARFAPDESFS